MLPEKYSGRSPGIELQESKETQDPSVGATDISSSKMCNLSKIVKVISELSRSPSIIFHFYLTKRNMKDFLGLQNVVCP